jgi:hypothetical protein
MRRSLSFAAGAMSKASSRRELGDTVRLLATPERRRRGGHYFSGKLRVRDWSGDCSGRR